MRTAADHMFAAAVLLMLAGLSSPSGAASAATRALQPSQPVRRHVNSPPPATTAAAPGTYASSQDDGGRLLGGHYFLKNGINDFAFNSPYINSTLEAAMATVNAPGAESQIKAVGISPSVTGQFRLYDMLGIEIGAQLSELGGSDAYSALVLGANFTMGYSAAARLSVYRSNNLSLTPALFYSWTRGISFSPLYAVDALITTAGQARGSAFLINTSSHEVRPTLLAAYAVSPTLGLMAEGAMGFDFTSVGVDQSHTSNIVLGLGADVNLEPELQLPIGLTLAFRDVFPLASTYNTSPILGLGVYEMINKKFNFGAEFSRLMTSAPSLSALLSLTAYY
ncbi:MAG: hypothetical protein HY074_06835 [Deltaproteobacteria bacterium]|nr:hypothetical protein [Deltaproteobacteria bacterium]